MLKEVIALRRYEPRIGTRKIHHRLNRSLGRDKLFGLLKSENLLIFPKKRYRRTTYSKHSYAVAPNLIKELKVERPKQVLVSDITYITLARGFAYLFLVTDLYSRKIVGHHLSRDLSHHSALLALSKADLEGVCIHHSDRGCQYCCHEYLDYLKSYRIKASMTDESHCYQNAVAERVNGILKLEFNLDSVFGDFKTAKEATEKAIEIYNSKRTHWSLNLKTPREVYELAA